MKLHERIEINPEIMFGKSIIKGTRITVEHILRKLAGGMSSEEIIKDHPHLKVEDIFAAEEFAAVDVEKFHFRPLYHDED